MALQIFNDISTMQSYSGTDNNVFIDDPLTGGDFKYAPDKFYLNLQFSGSVITDTGTTSTFDDYFQTGQTIIIAGTAHNDGNTYVVTGVTANTITCSATTFTAETINAYIGVKYSVYTPGSAVTFAASTGSSGTALASLSDSTTGLLTHGFKKGDIIYITGNNLNNGAYRLDNLIVSGSTSIIYVESAYEFNAETPSSGNVTISRVDGGTIFEATGKGSGFWQRLYDMKDGLNVTWFGAKGDNTANDTVAIQKALYAADSNTNAIAKVVVPPGEYRHTTLYVPSGVLFTGSGAIAESLNTATTKLMMIDSSVTTPPNSIYDSIRLVPTTASHNNTDKLFWYGGITNLSFFGNTANPKGWAISCRDINNVGIAPQDMNFFENLQMRAYPQGAIEFPSGAVPLNVRNVKIANMYGPGIYFTGTSQSVNFDNVSVDHCIGGAIWLDKLGTSTNVIITNLKSEEGPNSDFSNTVGQGNPIICSDCSSTPVIIDNANHQNIAPAGVQTYGTTVAMTNGVSNISFTSGTNPFTQNNQVSFPGPGLPSNITANQVYYVVNATSTTFQIAATPGGTAITPNASASPLTIQYYPFQKPGDLISLESSLGTPTFNSGNTITISKTVVAGDTVKFYAVNGSLPTGITAGQIYYVVNPTGTTTFQIATSAGGSAISFTLAGGSPTYSAYKQITSGTIPKIGWRSAAFRIRTLDYGNDPLVIAKTDILYSYAAGGFNIDNITEGGKVTADAVGVGTLSPAGLFNIVEEGATADFFADVYSSVLASNSGRFLFRRARGTVAAPAAVAQDDTIGIIGGVGYNSGFNTATQFVSPSIVFNAGEAFTTGQQGTYMVFNTTPNGATNRAEAMRLTGDKFLGLGGVTPGARLTIGGAISDALGSNGNILAINGITITDTSANTTLALACANSITGPTLSKGSAFAITEAATLTIAPPVAGGSASIANAYSLRLSGGLKLTSTSASRSSFTMPSGSTAPSAPVAGDFINLSNVIKFYTSVWKRLALFNDAAPANGQILIGNGTDFTVATPLTANGITYTAGAGSGTWGIGTITGATIAAGSNTITGLSGSNFANAAANTVLGNNSGSAAAPSFQTSLALSGTVASQTVVSAPHFAGSGSAPTTNTLGTNVTSATVTGNDAHFKLTIVTSGAASGSICAIAFAAAYASTPVVVFSCANTATATGASAMAMDATSTSSISFFGSIAAAGTYVFNVIVGQ